jgi:hypothetical protein
LDYLSRYLASNLGHHLEAKVDSRNLGAIAAVGDAYRQ